MITTLFRTHKFPGQRVVRDRFNNMFDGLGSAGVNTQHFRIGGGEEISNTLSLCSSSLPIFARRHNDVFVASVPRE